jgi:cytochrome c oxidase subunit 4
MSAHAPHAEAGHPQSTQYVKIAVVLSAITAAEVAVYYLTALRGVLPVILIALSSVKFALVVMYYMHLKFDHPLFTTMFLFGLVTAIFTITAFLAFFGFVNL